ncbi:MAG: guanylate kinase, partial [Lachnospiraceae bacterium]|nr:guanylate kinase [Lachnospiraceae bacterium]
MGKLFYIMGKSATGKDTIYADLLSRKELGLRPYIIYTTRPMRAKESDGVEYHFVTADVLRQMQDAGKVIELRTYKRLQSPWLYR